MKATVFHSGLHLKEEFLLPPESSCPLCSYRGARSEALRLQSDPYVSLLACPNCSGYSASRLPTEEALRAYYSRYYEGGTFQDSEKVTFHNPQRFARHVLQRARPYLRGQSLKILDFGGGDGNLSLAIAQLLLNNHASHVDVILVDYNAGATRTRRQGISLACHERLDTADAQDCDLVLASGILEHIPYPQADFIRLLSAVRPGGVFYARTPCVASLFRILQSIGLPVDFTYPAHVHDMGEAYWSNILKFLSSESQHYSVIGSQPSIVETALRKNVLRTLAAYLLKFPWGILGRRYPFVGGWEVFIRRSPEVDPTR
jgi:2-polyprenyl-3-methyl-5-hydroxy-6-metoxy-1,4-benzoquinol methylase